MRYTRFSLNPVIARAFVEMGWVRELNEGVRRIYDEMASFFLNEPVYSSQAMQVAMPRGRVTTKGLGEVIGKGPSLCSRTLKGLASERGLLEWHGSSVTDPSQYYTLPRRIAGGA